MKCPELKAKSAAVVSPRAPSAFGGSKLKLKYSKFVFKISKLSTLLYYYVSLNWMLCDGCLGIIWVVSMSLSKCITSSFARQEGSDIAAIKKTLPNLSLQSVLKRTLFKIQKYIWIISFSVPPHRGDHYVSVCPGWFCAGFLFYPNTPLVPGNQDSVWEYFYWCT